MLQSSQHPLNIRSPFQKHQERTLPATSDYGPKPSTCTPAGIGTVLPYNLTSRVNKSTTPLLTALPLKRIGLGGGLYLVRQSINSLLNGFALQAKIVVYHRRIYLEFWDGAARSMPFKQPLNTRVSSAELL
jgi:hypothetical protein